MALRVTKIYEVNLENESEVTETLATLHGGTGYDALTELVEYASQLVDAGTIEGVLYLEKSDELTLGYAWSEDEWELTGYLMYSVRWQWVETTIHPVEIV